MKKDPLEEIIDKLPRGTKTLGLFLLIGPAVIMCIIEALKGFRKE